MNIEGLNHDEFFVWGIGEAIKKLRPGSIFEINNRVFVKWSDPQNLGAPSWDDINKQMEEDKKVYESLQYMRDRTKEYPDSKEQIDFLWHEINSGKVIDKDSDWFIKIKSIKDKYPKP